MWRSPFILIKQSVSSAVRCKPKPSLALAAFRSFSSDVSPVAADVDGGGGGGGSISLAEAKKLMRMVNVKELKLKLLNEGKEAMGYSELLRTCESVGVAKSRDEAAAFARVLDEAGVVLIFRDKVYLYPDKVVDLVRRAVPLALTSEDDPRTDELKRLQDKKEEIDRLAHKQVRRILWSGLGFAVLQVGLFFRLTFWEFSWDVMEPVTFFATSISLVIGQGKLIKKHNFDLNQLMELQNKCQWPLDTPGFAKQRIGPKLSPSSGSTLSEADPYCFSDLTFHLTYHFMKILFSLIRKDSNSYLACGVQ
ncbi:hypothetical protein Vadar_020619 [Vaccinium darrowii]|uniref:Uncharacterized protein n=1 Tax=Vaccinium darrowii TaxID=229202 RepID=A0ACB7XBQ2_9ERIC|nr:hypothetical protein Vadar_020619 [Vaccinium darrowii]